MQHSNSPEQDQTENKPKVPLPAPVYFGLSVGLGYALSRAYPLWIDIGPLLYFSGWGVHSIATVILLWCFALFVRRRTTIMPSNPVNALVIEGPYRYSRNPMYVSLALFHLGILLNTGNIWQAVTLIPHMLAVRYWVIAPEEAYMQSRFGSTYTRYTARVRRWL